MWCSGARPAETLSRMGAGAQTYREKLQELLQPGEDKRKGDHLGECNSHMVGWSTDKASLPLEVHEIRVRGNWNSPQNGQFTLCKEVVCKKQPLTKQTKHMMVLKRWNRLLKNALECPSLAGGIQNPSGQGPEQADVIWTCSVKQLVCTTFTGPNVVHLEGSRKNTVMKFDLFQAATIEAAFFTA